MTDSLFLVSSIKAAQDAQFAKRVTDLRTATQRFALRLDRQRVVGIVAGYEDQNDRDTLLTTP